MNRFKSYQHIFSVITFLGFLNHPCADWQARFSTLMEALLYPITRQLPQNMESNQTAPENPETIIHKLRTMLQVEKESKTLTAERYVAMLEDGAIKTGLTLMEIHEELRDEFLPESSAELLIKTLDSLPTNNPFSYLVASDIWQYWQNRALPDIHHELLETIINPTNTCREVPQCMLAHARVLMKDGQFQKAKEAYTVAFSDPASEFEYLNCDLLLALDSQNHGAANEKLTQLKTLFSHLDLQHQEKEVAFNFLDWESISRLVLSGYQPQKHEMIIALIALFWQGEYAEAQKFLQSHELIALTPSQSLLDEFPNVGKTLLLTNLEFALQLSSIQQLQYTTADLELLKAKLHEDSQIHRHLFNTPVEKILPPLENLHDVAKLYEEIKSSNHSLENLSSAFVEHPQMNTQQALKLALEAIGKEIPNSLELKARVLMRLESADLETYIDHSGLNPEDTAKGKALLLAELGRSAEALEELKKVPGHKNSAQYHLLELQSLRSEANSDTIYQKVEVILERWPEFLASPLVIDVLFHQGLFDEICSATVENHSESHTWEQYVLSHIFTGKFKNVLNLLDVRTTELTMSPVPEPDDISGFYHLSLSLWGTLPDLAKIRQLERYRRDLNPKIASDLMPESQGFPQEIQTLLKELAAQYKTE